MDHEALGRNLAAIREIDESKVVFTRVRSGRLYIVGEDSGEAACHYRPKRITTTCHLGSIADATLTGAV